MRVASWALAAGVVGQLPPVADPTAPTGVSTRVEVVRVDVSVTDARGRPMPDLTPADFEIREEGTKRTIANFAFVAVGRAPAARASLAPSGKPLVAEPSASTAGATLATTRQARTIAFVVDDLNLSRTSISRVRELLKRFVERSLEPGDQVGIFRTGSVARASVALGSDPESLLGEIAAVTWNGQSGRERPTDPIQEGLTAPITIGKELDRNRLFLLAEASLEALRSLVQALEPLDGRKTVIFLSDGLKVGRSRSTKSFDRLAATSDDANRGGVVVYTLDPRGVTPMALEADDFDNDPGFQQAIAGYLDARAQSYAADHDGLQQLADATGGLFVHDTAPAKGLARLLVDQAGYYLLGFEAPAGGGARFHRLAVAVKRPHVRVRARSGYWSER